MSIPTFKENAPTERDVLKGMLSYNVQLSRMAKEGLSKMPTGTVESLLQNYSALMAGDYGDEETVAIPVDVIRETGLFASVTLSRMLWERYKLEKTLGGPAVQPIEEEKNE